MRPCLYWGRKNEWTTETYTLNLGRQYSIYTLLSIMYVVEILFISHQSHSKECNNGVYIRYNTIHYVYVCIHSTNELESSYGRSGGLICQWHFWCLKQFSSNLNDIRHTCSICNIDIGMTCITCEDQGFQSYDHLKKCFLSILRKMCPKLLPHV